MRDQPHTPSRQIAVTPQYSYSQVCALVPQAVPTLGTLRGQPAATCVQNHCGAGNGVQPDPPQSSVTHLQRAPDG